MGEFDLIRRYFTRPSPRAVLGVGDDCALLRSTPGTHLAISSDMLVAGRHFFADVCPRSLGHKALAVNLSDLAACGAQPQAFTLALALPEIDNDWLEAFSQGMWALAGEQGCELIGGDTTRGPLTLCITVLGSVPAQQALLRSGARAGEDIYASGQLGDARWALEARLGRIHTASEPAPSKALHAATQRMDWPTPRVALGVALRGIATAAADVSDGLSGDLGHILRASGVGAVLDVTALAACMGAQAWCSAEHATALPRRAAPAASALHIPPAAAYALCGGDDYELVFTAPVHQRAAVQAASQSSATPVTRIGQTTAAHGVLLQDAQGHSAPNPFGSFDHFGGA